MRITLEDVEKEKKAGADVKPESRETEGTGEKGKLKDRRSFKEKWCYFWDYYKWYVIIPAIIVYVIVSLTITLINENKDASIYIVFTNTSEVLDAQDDIRERYVAERGIDTKKNPVVFTDSIYYPAGLNENSYISQDTSAAMQKYTALITSNRADVTFTTSWVADAYQMNGCFADLREVFDEEFLEEHADKIYYFDRRKAESSMEEEQEGTSDEGTDEAAAKDDKTEDDVDTARELVPIGIYADSWSKLGEFYENEKPIMVIDEDGTNLEESKKFVEWVLEQK